MSLKLREHQIKALNEMHNGCILNGGVGSGKSITSLAYYHTLCGGSIDPWKPMDDKLKKDLYIITTAKKRNSLEWEAEMLPFLLNKDIDICYSHVKVVIDSWNNIKKYVGVKDAFFIFDENHVPGYGAWVKAFLKITRVNEWILLTATAGDSFEDYIPVFIANGYYRNKTEFINEHVEYDRFSKYPKIKRYHNEGRLIRLRNNILVPMNFDRKTVRNDIDIWCDYDKEKYRQIMKTRWDPFKDEPFSNAAALCYALRRVVNSDKNRLYELGIILEEHPRAIIFYNFDYELEILRDFVDGFVDSDGEPLYFTEYNGHKHEEFPMRGRYVYLVQYTSGCEGWNCITTDTIIFFSQTYSYKTLEQSRGRIDRLNTPFENLYYYHLKSRAPIDLAINRALIKKKKFNEGKFVSEL